MTSGELTLYHAEDCKTVYPAGTAFLEIPGDVHDARNDTAAPVEFLVSFTLPTGAPTLMPAGASAGDCGPDSR